MLINLILVKNDDKSSVVIQTDARDGKSIGRKGFPEINVTRIQNKIISPSQINERNFKGFNYYQEFHIYGFNPSKYYVF